MASTSTTETPRRGGASGTTPPRPAGRGHSTTPLGVLDPRSWLRPSAATSEPGARQGRTTLLDHILDLGIYVALIGLFVYFAAASPYFLTQRNLLNVGAAVAVTGVLA
ncbi:MAG: hypothetical protein QOE61_2761, partial [Micromonosporaceae bacterium]|nr:hypothetical protein [Micromonosporaceae bacterium]